METYKSKYSRKELEEKILSLTGGIDLSALQQQVDDHEKRIKKLEDDLKNGNNNPGNGGNCDCKDPNSQINQEITNIKNEITNIKNDITKIKNIIIGKNSNGSPSITINKSANSYALNPDYHYNIIEDFDNYSIIKLMSNDHNKMEYGQELYVFAKTKPNGDKKVKVYFPDATKIVNPQGEIITATKSDLATATEVTAVNEVLEISIIKLEQGTYIRMA